MKKSNEEIYVYGNSFCGTEISEYGIENGRVDYYSLARSFDHIPCNDLINTTGGFTKWELFCGELEDDETGTEIEIMQYFIVSKPGAELLKECGEIVFYNEDLNLYVWGVTFYGVSWEYVLTPIRIKNRETM